VLSFIAYSGKRAKHDAHYTVKTRERAQEWADEYLARKRASAQRSADERAAKVAKRAAGHKLKVGDVLVSSWGYDQTNVDYYEVTQLVGRSMVEVRQIRGESEATGDMQGRCVPSPGNYKGEPTRHTVGTDGASIKVRSFSHAYLIEPRIVCGAKVYPSSHWTAYA
jgi:hypothetical protein